MQRRIFSLLFLIAGVLLFQSAQAQTLVDANPPDSPKDAPTGTFDRNGDIATEVSILLARNGGTINGTGDLTLNVAGGTQEIKGLNAVGTGSSISMTAGKTVINMPFPASAGVNIRGAFAEQGGRVSLMSGSISDIRLGPGLVSNGQRRGVEAANPGSTLSATGTTILMNSRNSVGAFAYTGGQLSLTNCIVTQENSNGLGWGIATQDDTRNPQTPNPTILRATDTMISVMGDGNDIVAAYFAGATTTLDHSTVTGTGSNNNPLIAWFGGVVNVFNNSTVTSTGSHAALVDSGSVLNVDGSIIHGDLNGIVIADEIHTLGRDTVTLTGKSTLTNLKGAAFRVEGADVDITVKDSTVDSGLGATQHILLNVTQTAPFRAVKTINVTPAVTQAANHPSDVDLTADNSMLNGDILVDATSSANVKLEHNTVLNGAINENNLTGATGINPNELIPPTVIPPQTVDLGIDSTSTWNMRASSTLNTLTVNPRAHINFADPPGDPFKTLLMNNLIGFGGIFGMNVDLGLRKGDLIEILTKSEGRHLLTFVNRTQGSDLPVDTALLVVRTPDGGAGFRGEADGGTFRYFVVHGDGSSVTPVKNDWYLVRGDEIMPPETTEPPPTNPNPTPTPAPTPPPTGGPTPAPTPPAFTPGDNLPLPPEPPPRRLSRIDALTSAANAAIGTFSATMPLFYADMGTLVERMGELRLQSREASARTATFSAGISKEVVAPPPPVAPPAGGGVWVRGFGSGSHINDQVSRSFDQDLGGFQIGADKRLVTRYGDLYLGGFFGYFYAHRDFQNPQPINDATGTTNAFSVGGYSTLIHPSGFYADLVVKYTQLWNDFDAPNFVSALGLGPNATANYSIPTFGGSLEIGRRWDFGHFFLEPQGQIAGAWAGGADYTVSTGLRVSADSQTSLRGRLGLRAGYHFDWGLKAFEPYAKVSVINEFLGGDRITTNQTAFFPTLSGVGIQAAAGLTARITDSFYIYGEYDYADSDKTRMPWAVDAGLRWAW